MKDQIQFETNGLTVLAIHLDSDVTPLHVERDLLIVQQEHRPEYHDYIKLPSVWFMLHAVTDNTTEGQAEMLVGVDTSKLPGWLTSIERTQELLRSHGIDPAEKWVLLVKSHE